MKKLGLLAILVANLFAQNDCNAVFINAKSEIQSDFSEEKQVDSELTNGCND